MSYDYQWTIDHRPDKYIRNTLANYYFRCALIVFHIDYFSGSPSRWKHLSSEQPDPASLWKEFSMPNELDGAEGPKQFKTKRGRPSKTSKAAEGGDVTPKQSKKKSSPNKDKATPVTTASAMHRQEARK